MNETKNINEPFLQTVINHKNKLHGLRLASRRMPEAFFSAVNEKSSPFFCRYREKG